MLMQPITQYSSRIAQMFRNLRGLGIQSILPAAFETHRRWYLGDRSIVVPSSEIVDGDGTILRRNEELVRATANRLRISRAGNKFPGVGIRVEPDRTLDFASDWSAATLQGGGGPVAPVRTLNSIDVLDPFDANGATKWVFPAVSGAGANSVAFHDYGSNQAVGNLGVWLRGASGGEVIYLAWNQSGGGGYDTQIVTLTTEWQFFFVSATTKRFPQIGIDLRDAAQAAQSAATIYTSEITVENQGVFPTSVIQAAAGTLRTADDLQWPNTGGQLMETPEATTICVVVPEANAADFPTAGVIFDTQEATQNNGCLLQVQGGFFEYIVRSGGVASGFVESTTVPTRGIPNVISTVRALDDFRISIDGVQEDVNGLGPAPLSLNANILVGRRSFTTGREFPGIIGPILVFRRALTQRQINSVIHREIAPLYPGRLRMRA